MHQKYPELETYDEKDSKQENSSNMFSEINYKIPNSPKMISKVIGCIPSKWAAIEGYLKCPKSLYDQGRVAENTVLGYWEGDCEIYGALELEWFPPKSCRYFKVIKEAQPRKNDVLFKSKLFSVIEFYVCPEEDGGKMGEVKNMVKHYVNKGMRGQVSSDYYPESSKSLMGNTRLEILIEFDEKNHLSVEGPIASIRLDGELRKDYEKMSRKLDKIGLERINSTI